MPRRRALAAGVAVSALLLAGCGQWLAPPVEPSLFPLPPPPPSPPAMEEVGAETLHVVSIHGQIERRRAKGRWSPVSVGDGLRADEAIRTVQGSRAVLGSKEVGTVEIAERSELSVKEISRTMARLRLEQGRMSAEPAEGGRPLRIEDRSGGVSAEASTGKFVVMSQGGGHMVVAATAGHVRLSVGASSVVVNSGEQSEVGNGVAPSAPHAIPRSIFLKVVRPPAALQREMRATLRGETSPGAIVSVSGLSVAADQTGAFEADVPLREGKNVLVFEAEDPFGRTTRVELDPITVKRKVGDVKAKVTWEGGGK